MVTVLDGGGGDETWVYLYQDRGPEVREIMRETKEVEFTLRNL